MTAPPGSGLPAHAGTPGVPAAHPAHGGPPATAPAPKRSGGLRRFIVPVVILAALGYGGNDGGWPPRSRGGFQQFRPTTASCRRLGFDHRRQGDRPSDGRSRLVDNPVVHQGDLLASIDDGDFITNAARYREGLASPTQVTRRSPASAGRSRRRARSSARLRPRSTLRRRSYSAPRPTSSAPRSNTTVHSSSPRPISARSSGSSFKATAQTATAPLPRVAALGATAASNAAALDGARANLDVLKAQRDEATRQRGELDTTLAKAGRDLSFTQVLAPFDGVVGNKVAEVGKLRAGGDAPDGSRAGQRLLRRREFQGNAAHGYQARAEGRRRRRRARRQGRRGHGVVDRAGLGLAVLPSAARQCDRQLHQDRPARAGPRDFFRRGPEEHAAAAGTLGGGDRPHPRSRRAEADPSRRTRFSRPPRARPKPSTTASSADHGPSPVPHAPAAGQPGYAVPQFSIKRLAAFIFMVFGMFRRGHPGHPGSMSGLAVRRSRPGFLVRLFGRGQPGSRPAILLPK